jgi:hypothetical protein
MNLEPTFNFIPEDPEPVEQPEPFGVRRVSFWKRGSTRLFVAIIVLAVIVLGAVSALGVSRLLSGGERAKAGIEAAQTAAAEFDFSGARDGVAEAIAGLEQARSGLQLLVWTRPVPYIGDQVSAISAVVDAGLDSAAALSQAIDIAQDVYEVVIEAQALLDVKKTGERVESFADLTPATKADLLRALHNSFPKLKEAQVKLRLAQADLDRLDELNVAPQITEAVAPFRELLPELISGVEVLVPVAASVQELAGVDGDRQWLLLFENNSELRPGGGFLGVFGLLLMRDGEISNLAVSDTYSIDQYVENPAYQVAAPAPLVKYVGVSKWYFRDANWSPDFPTSAQTATKLLRQEVSFLGQPVPEIHGVIGITPDFVSRLINLTGPITVDGITFTSGNIRDLLEYEVEFGFKDKDIPFDERKAIVAKLSDELVDRLFHLSTSKWPDLFVVIDQSFSDKQIHLYSFDSEAQSAFVDAGWSGQIDQGTNDDFLMVIDANLAALKSDPVVERSINYSIAPDGQGGFNATTAITYKINGTFTELTTRYRTYTRVYAPLGSTFISSSGSLEDDKLHNPTLKEGTVDVIDDLGLTSFGTFTSIEPGQSRTLSFTYRLPPSVASAIKNDVYQLQVAKQLGTQDHALTLDLNFGKKVRTATPPEDPSEFGDNSLKLETTLDQDLVFTVQF